MIKIFWKRVSPFLLLFLFGCFEAGLYAMEAKPGHEPFYVPPPPAPLSSAQRLQTGTRFSFQWNPPTCRPDVAGAQLQPWPAEAQAALLAAAGVMESLLLIRVPIEIQACWWNSMTGSYLGTGGPSTYSRNEGYPLPAALYPISLANQISDDDLSPGAVELAVNFNGSSDWYFGTDGFPGGKYDFMTVALHELTHGLGFIGNMISLNSVASCGDFWAPYCPTPFDSLAVDPSGNSLVTQIPINPVTVAGFLTSESYLKGTELLIRNGSLPARLSTPAFWSDGSSYTHLDSSYSSGTNALMTPSVSTGTAIHHPGPVVLGLFKDMGWTLLDQGPVVLLSGPTSVPIGVTASFTADLWPKPTSGPATYTWTGSDQPPVQHSHTDGFDTVALVWNTPGTKNVQVSVNYSGETLAASRQVTVLSPVVQLSGPASVPVGGPASFTADLGPKPTSGPATYTWTGSDHPPVQHSHADGFDTVALVWNTPGTKNVQVSVSYSGETLAASRQITVFQALYLPLIMR